LNLIFLDEPELEFGAGRHIDIRFGITNHGPLDLESNLAPQRINLGIVGDPQSMEGVAEWFEKCRGEIVAKSSNKPALFPRFPGNSLNAGFRSTLVIEDKLCRQIRKADVSAISTLPDLGERVEKFVELFLDEIKYLAQNSSAKVIVCAIPLSMLEAMGPGADEDEEVEVSVDGELPDFHDLLKARAMQLYHKPIQLVLPSTYDESKHRKQTRTGRVRTLQDEATRAWNIHTAIYYKAEGVPWRLPRASTNLTVCYVGISFYRSLDKSSLLTSVAQVFNERGEGVVVRGGTATISKYDRQPHLSADASRDLLKKALDNYRDVHHNFPARSVIHKSSLFDENERAGFEQALSDVMRLLTVLERHVQIHARAGRLRLQANSLFQVRRGLRVLRLGGIDQSE